MLTKVAETVRGIEPRGLSRPELVDLLAVLDGIEAATTERRLAVLREIDELGDKGLPASAVNRSVSHRSVRRAQREVATAETLGSMPHTAEALACGEITVEHADTLARAAQRTSPAHADDDLLSQAKTAPADLFAKRASSWATRHEPAASAAARHAEQHTARELIIWHDGGDDENGSLRFAGQMDSAISKTFTVVLQERIDALWRADGGREGAPDEIRSPAQRALDALVELVLEDRQGGASTPRYMVHVVIDVEAGSAEFLDGAPVPATVLADLGDDALSVGHLFAGAGRPLWLGRSQRLASDAQWLARIVADRGCTDCGAGPQRCQMHHVERWETGGPSDIDNFELKCHTDHGLQHRGSRGDPRRWRRHGPEAA